MEASFVTKELALKAVLHGACEVPKVGTTISELDANQLHWVATAGYITPAEVIAATGHDLPVWALSAAGSGSGDGYGSGDGDGYGYGYGSGYGYGYGSGDGSGDGDGSG